MITFKQTRYLMCAVAMMTAALAAFAASPSRAGYPGRNGTILFTSTQDGGVRHIFVGTGTAITDLTGATSTASETEPHFSPDGTKIVFTRGNAGLPNAEIFVMNANGTGRIQLTNTPQGNYSPTWSPDGKEIAFTSDRTNQRTQIFVMNADGSHVHQIAHDSLTKTDLVWSPKGDLLAFSAVPTVGVGSRDIYTVKPDGTGLRDITNDPRNAEGQPDFSPDGRQIVYGGGGHPTGSVGGDLWIMNSDGSNNHPLLHENNGYSDGGYPAWSPDGSTIAFGANNGSGYYHLWSVPAGGGQNSELVTNKIGGDQEVDWQPHPFTVSAPRLGVSADVAPVSGTVLIKPPGSAGFVSLTGAQQIPTGSVVDTRSGSVKLTTATGSRGKTYSGTFSGAIFRITQSRARSAHGLTELALVEDAFAGAPGYRQCTTHAARDATVARSLPGRTLQRLRGSAHGRFRTRGRYSSATVHGTVWDTTDRCDGTLTTVHRGVVTVSDFRRHKTITLRAGHSYLARAR